MGGKPTGARKQLYFCFAGLILLSLSSCAVVGEIKDRGIARRYFIRAQERLAGGDFDGSLEENQRVLALANGSQADEALFNIGLLYAHFGNPKKDYQKSLASFRKLVKDHPQSPLVEQAKIWSGVLEAMEKLNEVIKKSKQVDIEIEEKKRDQQR